MSWTKRIAERGTRYANAVRVGLASPRGAKLTTIMIGRALALQAGYAVGEKFDILLGADTHAGMLKFVRAPQGEFTWRAASKGKNSALRLALALSLPRAPEKSRPVTVRHFLAPADSAVEIRLPAEWLAPAEDAAPAAEPLPMKRRAA